MLCESCCCLVAELCQTLCDPVDCSIPGFRVLSYLLEDFAECESYVYANAVVTYSMGGIHSCTSSLCLEHFSNIQISVLPKFNKHNTMVLKINPSKMLSFKCHLIYFPKWLRLYYSSNQYLTASSLQNEN